ncbi:MFS general substrate transporter [Gyrodon lividus]|nr:MFS general substrate transporter [Gyrodon lividus]
MSLPAARVDAQTVAGGAFIALSSTSTRCASPLPPSKLEYSENIELAPVAPVASSEHHESLGSDVQGVPQMKSKTQRFRGQMQFVALCWFIYLEGWNDGSNGPLLPRIQRVYGVGYVVVSLIFVFACLGFITGALSNVVLTERLGFGKVMVLGSLFQVVAYSIESFAPPFPVFVFAYFLNGIGLALQNAQSVGYVASFKENAETKMGVFMAAYGAGALSSPLVATQFSQLSRWSFHYLTSLGVALINTVVLIFVFRLKRQEECLTEIGISAEPRNANERSHFRQIFALKDVHLLASFVLIYVGAEVTIGGWIVTYIIDVRGGGPSSGYISTGFFGGLMIGRVALLRINEKVGERIALFIYAICAIILEIIVWLVPSLVGDAVAVAIIGMLMGPMYPIAMNHCGRVLPRWLLTGSIGWIAGSGQAGSALVPFMAGAIASRAGLKTLQPVLVGILSLMTMVWALVPKSSRRHD